MTHSLNPLIIGIAWCLAWGEGREPDNLSILQQMREALRQGKDVPDTEALKCLLQTVYQGNNVSEIDALKCLLQTEGLDFPQTLAELQQLTEQYPTLWTSKIGLVYGGATKIKQYVFESAKLPDIRGASALLDRINLIDIPAFFNHDPAFNLYRIQCQEVRNWLDQEFPNSPNLSTALIPELIIYSTGGNILAFCPAAFVDDLANAIEKRYTHETLVANSCAVGDTFRLLELRFGLLKDSIQDTFWLEQYRQHYKHHLVQAYFGNLDQTPNQPCISAPSSLEDAFENRKSFNEITTKLSLRFHQRRSGNPDGNRPSRRYPPMFETHPYLLRDESERRSATSLIHPPDLPRESRLSDVSARKRVVGDRAKTGISDPPTWYKRTDLDWNRGIISGWVDKFEAFLKHNPEPYATYCAGSNLDTVKIPQSLTDLSRVSNGFVAYIYADGNNMGGFIQKIRTATMYQGFSQDVAQATEYAVYQALAYNLHPREVRDINDAESRLAEGDLIHPFEIITIGGDDILLIVPASQGLAIAKMIGEQFEKILLKQVKLADVEIKGDYQIQSSPKPIDPSQFHRYSPETAASAHCQLSTSIGVLITAYNTPIYYANRLVEQLLKSAKKRAKRLRELGYCGGTVDFLVMKGVTMISSNIEAFRNQALTKDRSPKLNYMQHLIRFTN